jgi:hypothetical protein
MSLSYSQCSKQIGIDRNKQMPEIEYRWVGYSAGKIIECKSMTEAKNYTLNDRLATPESVKRREDFLNSNIEKERLVIELFKKSLRSEYNFLPKALYDVCYAEAYKRGYTSGYDSVAEAMADVVNFAKKVKLASPEEAFND